MAEDTTEHEAGEHHEGAHDAGAGGGGGPDAPAKKARREKLIVGGTLLLVVLTYILVRRSQANAATTSATSPSYDPGSYAGPGTYGGGSGPGLVGVSPNDPTIQMLETQISGLSQQIAAIPGNSTQVGGANPNASGGMTTTSPPFAALAQAVGADPNATIGAPSQIPGVDLAAALDVSGPGGPTFTRVNTNVGPYTAGINGQISPIQQMLNSSDPSVRARAAQIIHDANSPSGH